jgi:hypothetical protein
MRYQGLEVSIPVVEMTPIVFDGEALPASFDGYDAKYAIDLVEESIIARGFAVIRSNYLLRLIRANHESVLDGLAQQGEIEMRDGKIVAVQRAYKIKEVAKRTNIDWPAFPRDVSEGAALMSIARDLFFHRLAKNLLHANPIPDPGIYVRATSSGNGTQVHVDRPTNPPEHMRSLTIWLPLVDIDRNMGALFFPELSENLTLEKTQSWWEHSGKRSARMSAIADDMNGASLMSKSSRLHTMDFRAGDVAIFPSTTIHGTFDHAGLKDRIRLSMDFRCASFGTV